MSPAENENPRCISSKYAMASESPVSTAWMMYNGKATNMNANSSGSVTPVRKAVSAAADRMPTASFLCRLFATWIMARAAAGRPNIRIG